MLMRYRVFWLLGLMVCIGGFGLAQDETTGAPPLEIVGGVVDYDIQKDIVTITANEAGDPTVIMGERSITARRIVYNKKEGMLHADEEVRLWDAGSILEGAHLVFSLEKEEGTLDDVKEAEISPDVYFSGESLTFSRIPAENIESATQPRNKYTLYNGTVTACELPFPHYHIKSEKVVIIPDDRLWTYNMLFHVGKTPLMYAPFFTRSLERDNKLVYFFSAAHYSHLGFGFFNRLMYRPNENYITNLYGDFYTEAGFGEGAKFQFDVPHEYGPKGQIYGYAVHQQDEDNDYIHQDDTRYNLAGNYEQDLPYDIRITARGHKFSDSEYRYDYDGPESNHDINVNELDKDIVSFVNIAKAWDAQSLRLTAAARLDDFYYSGLPFVERMPQLHYMYYPSRILGSDFMLDFELDYGRYRREEGVTYPLDEFTLYDQTSYIDEVDRFDSRFNISRSFHLPESITLKPWIGYRATHYANPEHAADDPADPDTDLNTYEFDAETRNMVEGGAELYTRKTYEFDPFLNHYEKMRLVMEPTLQYGYFHPDIALSEIGSAAHIRFPYIDITDEYRYKMHRVSTLLRTKVQGKNAAGATSEFLRFGAGFSYDRFPDDNLRFDSFEYFDDQSDSNDERFSDLIQEFSISPFSWLTLGNDLRYDIEDRVVRSSFYYANLRPVQRVSADLGLYTYRYPFISAEEQQDVTLFLRWILSKKYELYYHTRYDIDQTVFRSNEIGIMRDLHDFYAIFQLEHESHPTLGDDYSFQIGFQFWGLGGRQGRAPEYR